MKHHAFENEIFDYCRKENKKILNAIEFLKKHDYIVLHKSEV